ncbi:uncharacterized protein N7496_012181 [Penicillium cataractarum]|uniref:Uncharacterized protein n=1 Tax=Penicillium cataractarum TaxID=2100454 RepID=A0A9W9USJ5_9EURO|nr:uncharacterized protein N7496_012181 [Penicillium cataractarum]KAJ5354969.1 hypothetical protein N7496_012181 [Penicillium cataractarum]
MPCAYAPQGTVAPGTLSHVGTGQPHGGNVALGFKRRRDGRNMDLHTHPSDIRWPQVFLADG